MYAFLIFSDLARPFYLAHQRMIVRLDPLRLVLTISLSGLVVAVDGVLPLSRGLSSLHPIRQLIVLTGDQHYHFIEQAVDAVGFSISEWRHFSSDLQIITNVSQESGEPMVQYLPLGSEICIFGPQ